MKKFPLGVRLVLGASIIALAIPVAAAVAQDKPAETPPLWAFPGNQPAKPPGPEMVTVPGSSVKFTVVQVRDRTTAVDWFPGGHPAMPPAVKGGRSKVFACGYCHLPEGPGRTESADVAGMPLKYLRQQIADMQSGARSLMDPHYGPAANMLVTIKQTSKEDADDAAKYFSSLKFVYRMKVVESADVPHYLPNAFVYEFDKTGPREALGDRIMEGPDDFESFEKRDWRTTFTAYVPVGAIARGAALAKGDDATARPACEGCHGAGLKGGIVGPPIAGRYPTGIFRQLYAFKTGSRNGPGAAFMKPMVANLSQKDMIDLAAYVGTLKP